MSGSYGPAYAMADFLQSVQGRENKVITPAEIANELVKPRLLARRDDLLREFNEDFIAQLVSRPVPNDLEFELTAKIAKLDAGLEMTLVIACFQVAWEVEWDPNVTHEYRMRIWPKDNQVVPELYDQLIQESAGETD
jgi:hypothetical protein